MGDADAEGFFFDATTCSLATLLGFQTTLELLEAVEARPPSLNCYGLHEWAMLYDPPRPAAAAAAAAAAVPPSQSPSQSQPPPERHQSLPLRLPQEALNAAVEEAGHIRCTHYDAFRFFTPAAVPLNALPPSELGQQPKRPEEPREPKRQPKELKKQQREKQQLQHQHHHQQLERQKPPESQQQQQQQQQQQYLQQPYLQQQHLQQEEQELYGPGRAVAQLKHEQPGCVHATMDLFKWAMKLHPWCGSELVADCLALARDARLVDMRASPYDLTKLTARQRRRHDRVDRDRDQASINKGFDLMVDTGSTGDEAYNNEEEERGEGTALFDVSPICVESREGRAEYQRLQEELYRRAIPLRRRLIGEYRTFLAHAASLPLAAASD